MRVTARRRERSVTIRDALFADVRPDPMRGTMTISRNQHLAGSIRQREDHDVPATSPSRDAKTKDSVS